MWRETRVQFPNGQFEREFPGKPREQAQRVAEKRPRDCRHGKPEASGLQLGETSVIVPTGRQLEKGAVAKSGNCSHPKRVRIPIRSFP